MTKKYNRIKIMKKPKSEEFIEKVLRHKLILDIGGGKPWKTGWIHKKYRTSCGY